jgi:hypothetical protein
MWPHGPSLLWRLTKNRQAFRRLSLTTLDQVRIWNDALSIGGLDEIGRYRASNIDVGPKALYRGLFCYR